MFDFDRATCERDADACSDSDRDATQDGFDCLDAVRTCDPDNPQVFLDALTACNERARSVSPGCDAALGG